MKIYVDFDDVICETARFFTKLADELFNIKLPYSQIQFFYLKQTFKLNDSQYELLMQKGHTPENLLSYEETPDASNTLNKWFDEGHDVSIITGRPFESYEPSRKWLDEHNLNRLPLFCVDKYGREGMNGNYTFSMTLQEMYNIPFDFAVDDSPLAFKHILHFKNCKTAVFNRPWNINESLPNDNFIRCNNWKEIDDALNRTKGLC